MRVVFVGQTRAAWKRVVLYLITFGIARRTWLYRVNKELDGHDALGLNHRLNLFLLCLPVGGPTVVTLFTARRAQAMLAGSGIRHGNGVLLWVATLVPILGNCFYIAWEQSRLNRYWAAERASVGHGIEIDVELSNDPAFLIELGEALKQSRYAGSRFDEGRERRKANRAARRATYASIRDDRAAVRAAGGSTPILPWLRPDAPAPRTLHITCGRCRTAFDVAQDPTVETRILCPNCSLSEVIPSLSADTLAPTTPDQLPILRVGCPNCGTKFSTPRSLTGATTLTCPACGRSDTLAAPEPAEAQVLPPRAARRRQAA
ncbi:MAG: hypothetical protein AABX89_04385 [Candidatus Thermoplasmatota archaeon]